MQEQSNTEQRHDAITYKPITYKPNIKGTVISVMVDGRMVGHIKKSIGGLWFYMPRGSRGFGETFKSLSACKQSLEAE